MLTRRRKQVSLQRALAFVKRLSTLSLHVLPNASVGVLAATRATLQVSASMCSVTMTTHAAVWIQMTPFTSFQSFPKCDLLLDNEGHGNGIYLPELDEPEHCNAQNTALWELHALQVHTSNE